MVSAGCAGFGAHRRLVSYRSVRCSPTCPAARGLATLADETEMNTISTSSQSASTQLYWGLRTYAWLIALCIAVLGLLAPILQSSQPRAYEAEALIVAEQLGLSSEALPRYGEAVFNSGAVALAVASNPAVDSNAAELIPSRLQIETAQDSVVFRVVGQDEDPQTAAFLANTAAAAFLPELNKPGAGVGVFDLQDEAQVPTVPADEPLSWPVAVVVGGAAGGVFGLGLVLLILVVWRPVIEPEDATAAVGVPVLGSVTLTRFADNQFPGPRGVPGLASVTRWLMDAPVETVFLASSPRRAAARERLSVMLALALSRLRPVSFHAATPLRDAAQAHREEIQADSYAAPDDHQGRPLVIVDGAEPLDAVQSSNRSSVVVLVVPRGLPRSRLNAMASEYLEGELLGIILYRVRSRALSRSRDTRPPRASTHIPRHQNNGGQLVASGRRAESTAQFDQ